MNREEMQTEIIKIGESEFIQYNPKVIGQSLMVNNFRWKRDKAISEAS